MLELDDIQGTVLRYRPQPYFGGYLVVRIDDPRDGREGLRRLVPQVASATTWWDPPQRYWLGVALSYQGLKAIGLPQGSLDSFPDAFREGMAARAELIGDVGDGRPELWQEPWGTSSVHLILALFAQDMSTLESLRERATASLRELPGISVVFRLRIEPLPSGRTHFGYTDGISDVTIEGSGLPTLPGHGPTIKAGEFVLGYEDETGNLSPVPLPEVLGRNGSYFAFRKLQLRVAELRRYLRSNSTTPDEEELLAAKMLGRWRSGAPLALAPERDDPALAADRQRNNDFLYYEDDPRGLKCPLGSHIRRMNPRDGLEDHFATNVNLHRIHRLGGTFGPMLPEGVLDDDGADRGMVFGFIGASLTRQFEFAKRIWMNDGDFVGLGHEQDPLAGANDGTGTFTIPKRPVRRRLQNVPRFVICRGGEYFFMPSIRALDWLANLGA